MYVHGSVEVCVMCDVCCLLRHERHARQFEVGRGKLRLVEFVCLLHGYVHAHTHTHTYTESHTHSHTHAHTHTHTLTHMHIITHSLTHVYIRTQHLQSKDADVEDMAREQRSLSAIIQAHGRGIQMQAPDKLVMRAQVCVCFGLCVYAFICVCDSV